MTTRFEYESALSGVVALLVPAPIVIAAVMLGAWWHSASGRVALLHAVLAAVAGPVLSVTVWRCYSRRRWTVITVALCVGSAAVFGAAVAPYLP